MLKLILKKCFIFMMFGFVMISLNACEFDEDNDESVERVCTFEKLTLDDDSFGNGADDPGTIGNYTVYTDGFTDEGVNFGNNFYEGEYNGEKYTAYNGFTYSNCTDMTTAGFMNQFSVYNSEGGFSGSSNFAVFYYSSYADPVDVIDFTGIATSGVTVEGFYVTNTTYAALSMKNGDQSAKKFGGASGDEQDWFKLIVKGIDSEGKSKTVEFFLADFRFDDISEDYILDEWKWVDLSSLGVVTKLEFSLESSDSSQYGMNTPAYFAMDDLTYVEN